MEKSAYERKITRSIDLSNHPKIEGWDFNKDFDFKKFIDSYQKLGFQGSNIHHAIQIIKTMRREKATIFLGCTSNMISSGLREMIRFLVQNKHIQCLVTTAGGIEEDIIKCLDDFVLGSFDAPGSILFESGVNRIGNIFVPNDRYTFYEQFMRPFLEKLQEKHGNIVTTELFNKELGLAIDNEESILYWAAKNNIPVLCPAPMDGALGDMIHYHRQRHPDFKIDVAPDMDIPVKLACNADKTGIICLGGGVSKHFILNANIFREGADYAVYITTAHEFDGSDSGGNIQEAMTWGKVKTDAPNVKVICEATIAFPLIMAGVFSDL